MLLKRDWNSNDINLGNWKERCDGGLDLRRATGLGEPRHLRNCQDNNEAASVWVSISGLKNTNSALDIGACGDKCWDNETDTVSMGLGRETPKSVNGHQVNFYTNNNS